MSMSDGSWLGTSACIERTTAMSSTEPEGRAHGPGRLPLGTQVDSRQRLAVVFVQKRLGVKGIDVRGAAVHEQVDHLLGPGREVRLLWGERVVVGGGRPGHGAKKARVGQHAG
jgi:hypothetical protein